jgi:hypothetical protein
MNILFLALATIITLGSVIPYLRDIIAGKTKPNIVSWITWTLITGIATAAEIAGHQYITAILTGASMLETAIVVALGLRYGYVKYSRFDILCQISALFGLLLWLIFNSPSIGVVASVIIDFIGVMPTIRHGWERPYEETWIAFALCSVGGVLGLLALSTYTTTSLAYPLYIPLINALTAGVIIGRQKANVSVQL